MRSLPGRFRFGPSTAIHLTDPGLEPVVAREVQRLRSSTGLELPVNSNDPADIVISSDASIPPEGYRLAVSPDAVQIQAADAAALFYAFQSIRQLLPPEVEQERVNSDVDWSLSAVEIADHPRFSYRGLMLDVSRHFFSVEFVKRFIDLMSRYKFNRFHWHLTDDHGWRIELPAYPRLTEVGAWRRETMIGNNLKTYGGDGIPHGGFYTQDEIRDVLNYATERFVTVIPEIEMPGHSTAALTAYPEYGCHPGPYEVPVSWGIKKDIYSPSDATFSYLEDVLTEVMRLFPSEYIHIGADEVPKDQWQASRLAQDVIQREGLADEDELQSWFIRRVEAFLNANGRRLIGWDEILEGGLAPNATVMSWRDMTGGVEAARQGHDVIMTPKDYVYFDYYQGDPAGEPVAGRFGHPIPLDTVYGFEPIPDELTEREARHIIGAQGNVWTEFISTPEHAEYMTYPRALALSEVAWSPRAARSLEGFFRRLNTNIAHLDALGVNYRALD